MNVKKGVLAVTTAGALTALAGCQAFDDAFAYREPGQTGQQQQQQEVAQTATQPQQNQQQAQQQVPPPAPSSLVREVQQALNEQGYDLAVDGIWGPETHQAVTQYQQRQGIQGDGQLNVATIQELAPEQQTAQAGGQQQAQEPPQQTAQAEQE